MSKGKTKKQIEEAVAPQATPTDASSKAMMMAQIVNGMAQMSPMDMTHFFTQAQALIGTEASSIPDGTAQKNLASVNSAGAVKEDLDNILAGEQLSEELKEKASTLFEAAINTRVALKEAEIEELYENRLNEEIDILTEEFTEKADQYLTYVAEQWLKENKTQVDTSIRTELAEEFIKGLFNLFNEHYVTIPEDKTDVVETMAEEIATLRQRLDDQINENIETKKKLEVYSRDEALKEVSEGLALTQAAELKKLTEGFDSADLEGFKKKALILREQHFKSKPKNSTAQVITENAPLKTEEKSNNPSMSRLVEFMRNSAKN